MELHEAVVCLANWRAEVRRLEAAQKALVKAVTESPEYVRLGEEYIHAHQMEGETEWTVRGLAEDQFRSTCVKSVHDAVTIELVPKPVHSLPFSSAQIDWYETEVDVRIATDLSAYL